MPSKKLFRIFEFWYCAHVLWRYDKKSNAEYVAFDVNLYNLITNYS